MIIPGFTADASLYNRTTYDRKVYLACAGHNKPSRPVIPAQTQSCTAQCFDLFLTCLWNSRDEFDRCMCRNDNSSCIGFCTGILLPLELCLSTAI
jgi:hypothetical protein